MTFSAFFQENLFLFAATAAALIALLFIEYRSFQTRGADLSPSALTQAINGGAKLIDLRSDSHYNAGHITGAKNIPFKELSARLEQLKKEDSIVLYCHTGNFSSKAINLLRKNGYEKLAHLQGGIAAWQADNLPVVKN